MADQSKPITISNFQKGMGASPYVGFGKMVGMDIFRKPGIIQPGQALNYSTIPSTSLTGLVTAQFNDKYGNNWIGCSDGKVFKNFTLFYTVVGGNAVHDIIMATDTNANDYIMIVNAGATIDVIGPFNTSPALYANWTSGLSFSSSLGWKKMFLGQDNVIYIANETKLASIVGFNFNSPSLNASCLQSGLPANRIVTTICELNRYVAIMTTGNYYSQLYFMDRGLTDSLGTGFYLSIGVPLPEFTCNQMINYNNRLYFFGNSTGTIYTTNMTSYIPVAVIPNRLQTQSYTTYATGISLFNNEIIFGIGGTYNPVYDTVYGLYSLRGNSLLVKNIVSSGQYGQSTNVLIGSVMANSTGTYALGWQTGSTLGLDVAGAPLNSLYSCWLESPMFSTADSIAPRTFQTIQYQFGQDLPSGFGMQVYYRTAVTNTWKLFCTYTFVNNVLTYTYASGIVTSNPITSTAVDKVNHFHSNFPKTQTTSLQVKVAFSMDSGASQVYGTSIELQSIVLI